MTVFISGGCKNGKSSRAQEAARTLSRGGRHYYVATMLPGDAEDRERVARHVAARAGLGFETLEQGRNILRCLESADADAAFLIDSVTALLANEMFRSGQVDSGAPERVAGELLELCGRVRDAVFVSDFLYSDAERFDEMTEAYRRGLALVDHALTERCDVAAELCAGNCILHKGTWPK